MSETKPPLGVRPAWMAAWDRVGELIDGIKRHYTAPNGDAAQCEKWAKEIVFQCQIIQRSQKDEL